MRKMRFSSKFVSETEIVIVMYYTYICIIGAAESGADKNIFWRNFMEETGRWQIN
jgi:hypothetical protein